VRPPARKRPGCLGLLHRECGRIPIRAVMTTHMRTVRRRPCIMTESGIPGMNRFGDKAFDLAAKFLLQSEPASV
jgi:hypothetical protein